MKKTNINLNPNSPTLCEDIMKIIRREDNEQISYFAISIQDPILQSHYQNVSSKTNSHIYNKKRKPVRFILLKKIIFRFLKFYSIQQTSFNETNSNYAKASLNKISSIETRTIALKMKILETEKKIDTL